MERDLRERSARMVLIFAVLKPVIKTPDVCHL